jgi:hypothetical protein
MSEAEIRLRLEASTSGLADRVPLVSARSLVSKGQRTLLLGLVILFVIGVVASARVTFTAITALFTLIYLIAVVYRIYLFIRSSRTDGLEVVTDEEALSIPEADLPSYTIMIPAYREASVMGKLIENVSRFEYPADRLEVLLLVEQDDDETLEVLRDIEPGPSFKLVVVPPGEPRTKPKALNFGLTLARGLPSRLHGLALRLRVFKRSFPMRMPVRISSREASRSNTQCGIRFFSRAFHRCMPRFRWEERRITFAGPHCELLEVGIPIPSPKTVISGFECSGRATT